MLERGLNWNTRQVCSGMGGRIQQEYLLIAKGFFTDGIDENGKYTNTKFTVLENSQISLFESKKLDEKYKKYKNELKGYDFVELNNNTALIKKEYEFSSPSLAACILRGIEGGKNDWKNINGESLKELFGDSYGRK